MAKFIFPPNGKYMQQISVQDEIYIEYTTPWNATDLVLYCYKSSTSNDYMPSHALDNPLPASGTYKFPNLAYLGTRLQSFPVACHYMLADAQNSTARKNGGSWSLTNTPGPARTFLPTQITSTSSDASTTASTTAVPTYGPDQPTHSGGISSIASIGIGIGVAVGLIMIAVLATMFIWIRRLRRQRNTTSKKPRAVDVGELGGGAKSELSGVSKVPSLQQTEHKCQPPKELKHTPSALYGREYYQDSAELP